MKMINFGQTITLIANIGVIGGILLPPGQRVPTYEISVSRDTPPVDILDLEDALTRLQAVDVACYDVTILRVYGELTGEETANAMRVSESTVDRKWKYAKAWLHRELSGSSQSY